MFMDDCPFTRTSCGAKPTLVITSTSVPDALMLNFPASSVMALRLVPFTCTVALLTGLLVESVTVPVTVCEEAAREKNKNEKKKNNLFAQAEFCRNIRFIIARGLFSKSSPGNDNCHLHGYTKYPNITAKNFQKNTAKNIIQARSVLRTDHTQECLAPESKRHAQRTAGFLFCDPLCTTVLRLQKAVLVLYPLNKLIAQQIRLRNLLSKSFHTFYIHLYCG
jgi:hypothetical protein